MTMAAETDNSIFVGDKPFMNYITGIVMQFTTHSQQEVVVKARGKYISRAVDVSEMALKRYLGGKINIRDIRIDSSEVENREGREVRVSTIEITLERT
jgi:archaea-specific DNA-binding protein